MHDFIHWQVLGQLPSAAENADEPIIESTSCVLGDGFHGMDCPKPPVKHTFKKPYFCAFRDAWYVWDRDKMEHVVGILKEKHGKTDDDIDAMRAFESEYFAERVPRVVPAPVLLHKQVQVVFEVLGPIKDKKTGKPLFDKKDWDKARRLLKEILNGDYSDPPGVDFYEYQLDADGRIKLDEDDIPLIRSLRGTTIVELVHRLLVQCIGSWNCGVELGDALVAEFRHRYNTGASERNRLGFPKLGHFDGWLVDLRQLLTAEIYGTQYLSRWANTLLMVSTPEQTGIVPLQEGTLNVNPLAEANLEASPLTAELQYLAKKCQCKVPPVAVHTCEERQTFGANVRHYQQGSSVNWARFANDWNAKFADGVKIFPKLPVHMRLYYTRWQQNKMTKDQVANSKEALGRIQAVHESTGQLVWFDLHRGIQDPTPLSPQRAAEPQVEQAAGFSIDPSGPGPTERRE